MNSKKEKSALPNVETRRGGETTSCARLASGTSPEVQCLKAENSHTGASSDCVPNEKVQWFVLRATYGRTQKALDILKKANVETYLPMHYVVKMIDGKRKRFYEPLLPNIIFARMTRLKSHEFVKEPSPTASWLKYFTDKTKPIEESTGLNPPATIPHNEMLNFIKLTSVNSDHIMILPPERCHFKSGELVRVVNGAFTGIVGRIGRAAGQQRVFVILEGICNVATAYIPSDFLQHIESF